VNKICLSVILQHENDLTELTERIAGKEPDLVEFRLDHLNDSSLLETIAKNNPCRIIATDRSHRNPLESKKMLLDAAQAGFDFVDVDLAHPYAEHIIKDSKARGVEVIVSHHDTAGTPSEKRLVKLLDSQKAAGSDICKIVTSATNINDNLTILGFLKKEAQGTRIVSFAMGKLGIMSRVLSPIFGAEFTFAALGENSRTAAGQLSIDNIRKAWDILAIT
jgi:3-dehydroquinate dehydratase-1